MGILRTRILYHEQGQILQTLLRSRVCPPKHVQESFHTSGENPETTARRIPLMRRAKRMWAECSYEGRWCGARQLSLDHTSQHPSAAPGPTEQNHELLEGKVGRQGLIHYLAPLTALVGDLRFSNLPEKPRPWNPGDLKLWSFGWVSKALISVDLGEYWDENSACRSNKWVYTFDMAWLSVSQNRWFPLRGMAQGCPTHLHPRFTWCLVWSSGVTQVALTKTFNSGVPFGMAMYDRSTGSKEPTNRIMSGR